MDTLYHPVYSDPGGSVNRCGTNTLRSCPFGTVSKLPPISAPIRCASLRGSPSAVPVAIGPVLGGCWVVGSRDGLLALQGRCRVVNW